MKSSIDNISIRLITNRSWHFDRLGCHYFTYLESTGTWFEKQAIRISGSHACAYVLVSRRSGKDVNKSIVISDAPDGLGNATIRFARIYVER